MKSSGVKSAIGLKQALHRFINVPETKQLSDEGLQDLFYHLNGTKSLRASCVRITSLYS